MRKIIFYTENYEYGGLEKFLFDFIYKYRYDDILLMFNDDNDRILKFALENKLKYQIVNLKNKHKNYSGLRNIISKLYLRLLKPGLHYYKLFFNYFYIRRILKRYTQYNNIFIVNGGYPAAISCLGAVFAAKKVGIPNIVLSVLSCPLARSRMPLLHQIDRFIDRQISRSVNFIHVNAQVISRELVEKRGFDAEKIKTIYTGVDLRNALSVSNHKEDLLPGLDKNSGQIRLGTIGFLGVLKGQKYLIEAIHIIKMRGYDNVKCLIVGSGPEFENLNKLTHKLGLKNNIVFLGNYSYPVDIIFRYIDIYVFSSLYEGFPYAILEAMAYKLPIVTTDAGGIIEQVEDEINGYLVEKGNSQQLADKIIKMIENKDRWKEFGQNSWNKVKSNFTIDKMLEQIDNLLVVN